MVFRLDPEIFEDRIRPESFHVVLCKRLSTIITAQSLAIPSSLLGHAVRDSVCHNLSRPSAKSQHILNRAIPGPAAAARASSPMKKSRSSVPLLAESDPPEPAPPVRYEGLFATAGRPDPEPPAPPTPPLVAMAVGKTNDGASLPAKPCFSLGQASPAHLCVLT